MYAYLILSDPHLTQIVHSTIVCVQRFREHVFRGQISLYIIPEYSTQCKESTVTADMQKAMCYHVFFNILYFRGYVDSDHNTLAMYIFQGTLKTSNVFLGLQILENDCVHFCAVDVRMECGRCSYGEND